MWNRITLKENGKAAVKRNYWKCVVVALIGAVVMGSVTYSFGSETINEFSFDQFKQELEYSLSAISDSSAKRGFVFSLLNIFVANILSIGCCKFFIRNAENHANLEQVLDGFRCNYGKNVVTMFLVRLLIVLWSLLLVIPGIVKAYSYMLVPYILADIPDISRKDALHLSEELMRGHKMNAFVLDLSFIGWHILNAITLGILGIFYINPYISATKAELYRVLRGNARLEA